jgi:putative membrane protein
MNFKLAAIVALASLAAIFILQNFAAVEVSFLVWSISMSRALLIFFSLAIGFLLGWFLYSYLAFRKKKR